MSTTHSSPGSGLRAAAELVSALGTSFEDGPFLFEDHEDLHARAKTLDKLEATRISLENQLRSQLIEVLDNRETTVIPAGEVFAEADPETKKRVAELLADKKLIELTELARHAVVGKGKDKDNYLLEQVIVVLELRKLEHKAELALCRSVRAHPLWTGWAKDIKGCGEASLGRLLGRIGDPYWNDGAIKDDDGDVIDYRDRPRTLRELRKFCGLHQIDGKAARKRKRQQANWNTRVSGLLHVIAECLIQAKDPHFREVYLKARAKYDDATHLYDCTLCSRKAGTLRKPGHAEKSARRIVASTFLDELWTEARRLHLERAEVTD